MVLHYPGDFLYVLRIHTDRPTEDFADELAVWMTGYESLEEHRALAGEAWENSEGGELDLFLAYREDAGKFPPVPLENETRVARSGPDPGGNYVEILFSRRPSEEALEVLQRRAREFAKRRYGLEPIKFELARLSVVQQVLWQNDG